MIPIKALRQWRPLSGGPAGSRAKNGEGCSPKSALSSAGQPARHCDIDITCRMAIRPMASITDYTCLVAPLKLDLIEMRLDSWIRPFHSVRCFIVGGNGWWLRHCRPWPATHSDAWDSDCVTAGLVPPRTAADEQILSWRFSGQSRPVIGHLAA